MKNERYKVFFELTYGRTAPERQDFSTFRSPEQILEKSPVFPSLVQPPPQIIQKIVPEKSTTPEEIKRETPTIGSILPETKKEEYVPSYEKGRFPGESETAFRFRKAGENVAPLFEGLYTTFIHRKPEKLTEKQTKRSRLAEKFSNKPFSWATKPIAK